MAALADPAPAAPPHADASRLSIGLIWGFCLLLVAGIWLFVIQQIAFERGQAIGDALRQNANRAIAFEQYVRRTLEAADLVTRYVGGRFARGDVGGEFAGTPGHPATIRGNIARNGTFLGVSIVDPHGNLVATSIPGRLPRYNVATHPAFSVHVARNDGRLFVSRPIYSPLVHQKVIWLSRRLDRPDGSFAGVIAINILPGQFTAFYRDAQVGPNDIMSVIGLDGITRARRTGPVSSSGEDLRGRLVMRHQAIEPNGTYLTVARDGIARYFSHRRLRDYALFVTYGVPETEVLAPSRHRATIFISGAALVSIVIIAFAALFTLYLSRRDRLVAGMARSNQRLREAQRIGQIGDWDYDLKTGETTWSPQLLAMYERDRLGSPTFEEFKTYLDEDGQLIVERAHADAVRTGEAQDIEYEVRLPSGVRSHHQSAVIPTFDAGGKVVRLHGIDQDVTARKTLDQLQTQVAHLSRIEAMNAMAATLAHELNQPLTAASNYLVGSRRRLRTDSPLIAAEVEQGMAAAEQQVHLAADIIRRVREMVSNPPRAVGPVSLPRIVDDALALVSVTTAYPGCAVLKSIAEDARMVKGDRIQIQQVLVNLVRNACDATNGADAPEIRIASRREDAQTVIVSVSDNGAGFAQPDGERFSPFATTKASGLGLGLSISRTIIEAHGGRIWIDDADGPGSGAMVSFTLPAARHQQEPDRAEAAA
jgi:two-component system, LuxR family, sensor kinase FixL